ncbi:MAG TPA: NAD(P)/FAD-dependent oxidoreductase [Actinomycetota bacterium]
MLKEYDADVIIIGGGPSGSALGTFLARDGLKVLLIEKDIHPRDHVGESLTPSVNIVLDKLGVIDKINDAGFIRKPGTAWTSPRAKLGTLLKVPLFEFSIDVPQPWTWQVERDEFDAILLRHAHENGVKVLQGVKVTQVLFEGEKAVGVRAQVIDGFERDLRAKLVVDATGRRALMASQLSMKRKDPEFNQYAIYSWFRGVEPEPPELKGYGFFYFVGLDRAWGWHFPFRNGLCSIGVVTDKQDFQKSGKTHDQFFASLINRNRTFRFVMRNAERVRPWWIEGDYSYKVSRFYGDGWMLVGDSLRFVDPIFSSGVDVALYSADYAAQTIKKLFDGGNPDAILKDYERQVTDGIDVWYDLIDQFYRHPHVISRYVSSRRWRETTIRTLQGNPYSPEHQQRARELIAAMKSTSELALADPSNLMRPGAIDEVLSGPDAISLEEETTESVRLGYTGPGQVEIRDWWSSGDDLKQVAEV